ncbi:MAG: oxygen-independent coproporphyrinogen III oxidase [Methylacidiphilales bacterium]|nr:oxygen-independent coproporphyrinogen III oxidase [Candidatus Methylacidiphilales bacterium]
MNTLHVDLDLVRKYNVSVPRYTSYPPATCFTEISAEDVLECIRADSQSIQDLSLYFHLPFCHSLCWFCGCTTVITTKPGAGSKYLDYLHREITLMAKVINPDRKVAQLHFGGGTPTFLAPDEIRRLGQFIRSHFTYAQDIEAGVEIDPRRVVRDHVTALRESGFNRASLGVQDFNLEVQKAIHRLQSKTETEKTVEWLREDGFDSLNIDLIYGLPHQTVASFEQTLNHVIELNPDRLAVFNYAHVPWLKPAQNILKRLPTPEVKLEMLKQTIEQLTSSGYVYIGMDHFARHDDELAVAQRNKTLQRNFQGYSTCGEIDIYAFGMSSISQTDGAYWQNQKDLAKYYGALDLNQVPISRGHVLNNDDKIRRRVIMRLMCDMSMDFDSLSALTGIDFTSYFSDELGSLSDLEADGLIAINESGLIVTELGRLLIRNIAVRFDAYSAKRQESAFSKSI